MKTLKYILLVVLLILSFNVKAAECDTKELNRLKELAKKIEFDYDYKLVDGVAEFSINAVNLNSELKALIIKDYYNNDYREFKGSSEATLYGFKSGERVIVTIKGFVPNGCSGVTVLTKTVKVPYYNLYYDEEKCKGNEDFKYCKLLLSNNITEKEYNRQFEAYLKAKEATVIPEEEKKEEFNMTIIYIIVAAVLFVLLVILLVTNIIRRRRKNKL